MKIKLDETLKTWAKYAKVYDPIKCASIDGTDCEPHDRAVVRAVNSTYRPNRFVKGRPECTIFVSRLNHETSKDTIKDIFSKYGKLKRFRMVKDIVTGMPKGYAFVEFEEEQAAEEAYRLANKMVVDGNMIFVDFECERLLQEWKPRRLGGGFAGKKESGQLRFGGRDRPFKKPIALELAEQEDKRQQEKDKRRREERRRRDQSHDRHKRKTPPHENDGDSLPPGKREKRQSPSPKGRTNKRPSASPKDIKRERDSDQRKQPSRYNISSDSKGNDKLPPKSPQQRRKSLPLPDAIVKQRSTRQENTKHASPHRERGNNEKFPLSNSPKSTAKENRNKRNKSPFRENVKRKSPTRESINNNRRRDSPKLQSPSAKQNGRPNIQLQSPPDRRRLQFNRRSPPRENDRRRSPLQRNIKHSPERDRDKRRALLLPPRNEIRPKHIRSRSPVSNHNNNSSPSSSRERTSYNRRHQSPSRNHHQPIMEHPPPKRDVGRRYSPLQGSDGQYERGSVHHQVSPIRHYSSPSAGRTRGDYRSPNRRSPPAPSRPYSPPSNRRPPSREDFRRQSDKALLQQASREYRSGRRSPPVQYCPRGEHNRDDYSSRENNDFAPMRGEFRPYSPPRVDFRQPPPSFESGRDYHPSHQTFHGSVGSFPPPRQERPRAREGDSHYGQYEKISNQQSFAATREGRHQVPPSRNEFGSRGDPRRGQRGLGRY